MVQLARVFVVACAALLGAPAQAQKVETIKIIVGYAPGGASDRAARLVADALREKLGATVIVENKAGAGGRVAAQSFRSTPATEAALMIGNPAVNVVAPLAFKNVGYDPQTDFVPVAQVSRYEFGVAVGPAVPVREVNHLLACCQGCRHSAVSGTRWVHSEGPGGKYDPREPRYNAWLRELGYTSDNPWEECANSGEDEDGNLLSGWLLRNSTRAARVKAEHSETPYITQRALDFIDATGDEPWCLHLSYIKPHWPCIAPAPYHAMYSAADVLPVVRSNAERLDPNPLFGEFMKLRVSRAFSRDEVRTAVIPAYMGLIKQIDDAIGLRRADRSAARDLRSQGNSDRLLGRS